MRAYSDAEIRTIRKAQIYDAKKRWERILERAQECEVCEKVCSNCECCECKEPCCVAQCRHGTKFLDVHMEEWRDWGDCYCRNCAIEAKKDIAALQFSLAMIEGRLRDYKEAWRFAAA